MRYDPRKIEEKWKKVWMRANVYEPDFKRAKTPFYNLMMFPYPSAEGLHIGSVRTFTGVDIYGRFKRMQGYDVFEPIGLDGFGIHSENFALKIGKHPMEHAKDSEKNFYRQLASIGNGFAWNERLETYDPEYYKWTQWIFLQMFKRGLAYRKKAAVNWCPGCKTVLADEQVVGGECERCGAGAEKKDLEQWFFKITNYAERLLQNLEKIDWSENIKIAQKNWIGKSEGATIRFPLKARTRYVLVHGYKGAPGKDFFPWLRRELEKNGHEVYAPQLPNPYEPIIEEQVNFLLNNFKFDSETVLITHSLGGVVALKLLPRLAVRIKEVVMVAPPAKLEFLDGKKREPLERATDWIFDFPAVRGRAAQITIISDVKDHIVPSSHSEILAKELGAELKKVVAPASHFNCRESEDILREALPVLEVFTTRPDTIFGATYMVVAPEYSLITNHKLQITNREEVEKYIKRAKAKTDEERVAEKKEKTGVELRGIKAINPATKEEIPIWVADYVLGNVGTGAIMAVPAHDGRDFDFAKKYILPIKRVVCPHYPAPTCPVPDSAYEGGGLLVDSGKFNGMPSELAKWEIVKFVGGERKVQYRLRDWLISRQRYWGPPIPMIFCGQCGWQPISEKDLPVKLPRIKNFRPTGTNESPLAGVEKFYKVRCPKCKLWARRETDVSDTFLDSAWYYLRYPSGNYKKGSWDPAVTKKWLPVDMYIGGAEHAVLHLLYVRFLAMALYDMGFLHFEEPFKKFRSHGLITKDGAKMSKSRGNVVNPDEYINAYGIDAIRMYLAFLAPLDQGGDFRDEGIRGITRFLERIWKFVYERQATSNNGQGDTKTLRHVVHKAIKKVTEDIESLQYNTAISALMILLNEFEKSPEAVTGDDMKTFLKLLAPFAPFLTEELRHVLVASNKGQVASIHKEKWPEYDPRLITEDTFELIIQVNGRVRGRVTLLTGTVEAEAKKAAIAIPAVRQYISGGPQKVIFVPNRLINFVV